MLKIDGLNVFAFSETKNYSHGMVPSKQTLTVPGWHVNNDRDQMASFYLPAQFRKPLYRPDVIKLILTAGGTERALEVADQARSKATVRTDVAKVLPPAVEIAVPRHGTTVESTKLEVRAIARSRGKRPIAALRLSLEGRPYRGQGGTKAIDEPKLGEIREVWSIELESGKHSIAVEADSLASHGTSESVEVTYEAPEPVQLPALYVLAVGITKYPGDLKLHYAANDAQAIGHVFREKTGPLFRAVEVKLPTDEGDSNGVPQRADVDTEANDPARCRRGVLLGPWPAAQRGELVPAAGGRRPREPADDRRGGQSTQESDGRNAGPGAGVARRLPRGSGQWRQAKEPQRTDR